MFPLTYTHSVVVVHYVLDKTLHPSLKATNTYIRNIRQNTEIQISYYHHHQKRKINKYVINVIDVISTK